MSREIGPILVQEEEEEEEEGRPNFLESTSETCCRERQRAEGTFLTPRSSSAVLLLLLVRHQQMGNYRRERECVCVCPVRLAEPDCLHKHVYGFGDNCDASVRVNRSAGYHGNKNAGTDPGGFDPSGFRGHKQETGEGTAALM